MIPRLKIPLSVTDGKFATVEQDSAAEVAQCVYSSLATEEGSRVELPDYGLPSMLFAQGGVDLEEVRSTVGEDEPRATEILTETEWAGLTERVTIGV